MHNASPAEVLHLMSRSRKLSSKHMNLKTKLIAALVGVLIIFGAGTYVGYQIPRTDPQSQIETVFTPYEEGLPHYLSFLDRARHSVHIAAYSFTDPHIYDKLIELHNRGVKDIHVLLDLSQTQGRSNESIMTGVNRLRAVGIEVVIGTSEKSHQIMHDKYTIVDGEWVEDGSWNYTASANKQANVLNFIHSRSRASLFMSNWQRMYTFMKAQQDARDAAEAQKK